MHSCALPAISPFATGPVHDAVPVPKQASTPFDHCDAAGSAGEPLSNTFPRTEIQPDQPVPAHGLVITKRPCCAASVLYSRPPWSPYQSKLDQRRVSTIPLGLLCSARLCCAPRAGHCARIEWSARMTTRSASSSPPASRWVVGGHLPCSFRPTVLSRALTLKARLVVRQVASSPRPTLTKQTAKADSLVLHYLASSCKRTSGSNNTPEAPLAIAFHPLLEFHFLAQPRVMPSTVVPIGAEQAFPLMCRVVSSRSQGRLGPCRVGFGHSYTAKPGNTSGRHRLTW